MILNIFKEGEIYTPQPKIYLFIIVYFILTMVYDNLWYIHQHDNHNIFNTFQYKWLRWRKLCEKSGLYNWNMQRVGT